MSNINKKTNLNEGVGNWAWIGWVLTGDDIFGASDCVTGELCEVKDLITLEIGCNSGAGVAITKLGKADGGGTDDSKLTTGGAGGDGIISVGMT